MSETKGIGFNRNVLLPWLDATAAFCLETAGEQELRRRITPVVAQDVNSPTNLRKTIAILVNIWHKTAETEPVLRRAALEFFQFTAVMEDRLWLHYGMIMLAYPFFFEGAAAIGRLSRYGDPVSAGMVRKQLVAEMGQLGSLPEAVSRIVYSLREWDILRPAAKSGFYLVRRQEFCASQRRLEAWLLACALRCAAAEEIPFADLPRLPALFPFHFSLTIADVRQAGWFEVQRQGAGLNIVRLAQSSK